MAESNIYNIRSKEARNISPDSSKTDSWISTKPVTFLYLHPANRITRGYDSKFELP